MSTAEKAVPLTVVASPSSKGMADSSSSTADSESPPIKRGYTFGDATSGGGMPITIQVCSTVRVLGDGSS